MNRDGQLSFAKVSGSLARIIWSHWKHQKSLKVSDAMAGPDASQAQTLEPTAAPIGPFLYKPNDLARKTWMIMGMVFQGDFH